jgi:hypothetical protein
VYRRLYFQSLARPRFDRAEHLVEWFGAVQAQDYAAAKWAIGLRARGLTDADIERAFNSGAIVRTHVLRPTWHFVPPKDLRWMLALSAPRVYPAIETHRRFLGFDPAVFTRCNRILAKELAGQELTRRELGPILKREGAALGLVLMRAELDAVIASGAVKGKHHTFALIDERVPPAKAIAREDALTLLARRYFRSHGPATLKDFTWWSGLKTSDARIAIESACLESETINGTTHWLTTRAAREAKPGRVHLIPNFDEYFVAYVDRSAAAPGLARLVALGNTVVAQGRVVGTWRRTVRSTGVRVDVSPLTGIDRGALARAVGRYGAFLGRPASFRV